MIRRLTALLTAGAAALTLVGCTPTDEDPIRVTGSATVAPITEHMARKQQVTIDQTVDGTLDGFEEFCRGRSHLNNASVPIQVEQQKLCAENGVDYLELPVAMDALSVVRNSANDFATDLSLEELASIWTSGSGVTTWADVRDGWPEEPIVLVGRPSGSGTFDYFTRQVTGAPGAIREDYRATDDIAELTGWIAADRNALGFMGVGNYLAAPEEDRNAMATVAVDGAEPSLSGVQDGTYGTLSRQLFLYASVSALREREDVRGFVEKYLADAYEEMPLVYYYRLRPEAYEAALERLGEAL